MKCPEVKHWLYGLKPRSSWPVELVRHLQECPRCLKLRTRLAALDRAVDEATKAPVGESAKARVAAAIQELPQQPGKPAPRPAAPRHPRWVRWGAFVAGAAALVAFGMLVGPHEPPTVETRTVEVVREKLKLVPYSSESALLPVLLKRNVELVRAKTPAGQFRVLHAMAEDCRAHAVLLMRQGPGENLPLVVGLHQRLLLEGIADQSQRIPLAERAAAFEEILAKLQRSADDDPLAGTAPTGPVRDFLHEMQSADRQAAALLRQAIAMNVERPQRPMPTAGAPAPALLVAMALNSCGQADSLAKAQS
jgi:hypothetical protein